MTEQPVEEREEGKERPHHDYDDGDEMTTEANLQAIIQALPIEQRTIHYVMACALYICRIEVSPRTSLKVLLSVRAGWTFSVDE